MIFASAAGSDEIDGAVRDARAQRRPVARRPQRRHEVGVGCEPADVHVGQMQMMDRHIAGDGQAFLLRGAYERHALRA